MEKRSPVIINGSCIARTFWGLAWCRHLESLSDYFNRLARGRSYVRSGAVVDLGIEDGQIRALVQGRSLYRVDVAVKPLNAERWAAIRRDCAGQIDSVMELLRGRISGAVMGRMCDHRTGLFPSPGDIRFQCSCLDWAEMCKHTAAVLYAVGNRLDRQPELLFKLRCVNHLDLVSAATGVPVKRGSKMKRLRQGDLSSIFGIEIDTGYLPAGKTPSGPLTVAKKKVAWPRPRKTRIVVENSEAVLSLQQWPEHCLAAKKIRRTFGVRKALEYLVGEKFLTLVRLLEPQWRAAEGLGMLNPFAVRIKKMFSQNELEAYIHQCRNTDRTRLTMVFSKAG